MPRRPRFIVPDLPHHVTARGNFRQPIFFSDRDRRLYLRLLQNACELRRVRIHAYCLMPNHVHLIAVPADEQSFSKVFHSVHGEYAKYINKTMDRKGHLFDRRYFSTVMDESHYWEAMVYVELNPERAGLVHDASDWEWSSARAHLGLEHTTMLAPQCQSADTWSTLLQHGLSSGELLLRIREATRTGQPLGDDAFLDILEEHYPVQFRPNYRGCPNSEACGISL